MGYTIPGGAERKKISDQQYIKGFCKILGCEEKYAYGHVLCKKHRDRKRVTARIRYQRIRKEQKEGKWWK